MTKLQCVLLMMALATARQLPAQILDQMKKPLDYSKQADVTGKNIQLGDLHYGTVPQSSPALSGGSPLTKGDLHLQNADLGEIQLKSVDLSTVSQPVLPQANYEGKRAVADKDNDKATVQADETKQNAPITNRQIRVFAPGGEEQLKQQINKLHP
jgi:hypothetical protein